jgi:hypothetical protein
MSDASEPQYLGWRACAGSWFSDSNRLVSTDGTTVPALASVI